MTDWDFSDEARDAGRDVPDLDEKALVIEGRVNLGIGDEPSWSREVIEGRDPDGHLFVSMGPLEEIAAEDPLWARYLDGDR